MAFRYDPLAYVRGREQERAVASLDRYLGHATGAFFERTADPSLFHRITEKDLVAVLMLGGRIPPAAAWWLIGPGAPELTAQLVQVPRTESTLWDRGVPIGEGSPLGVLHRLVRDRPGMNRAKTSRLLAAKRPHLVPIADRRVCRALGSGPDGTDPRDWRAVLADGGTRAQVVAVRDEVPAGAGLSLLRVMHIVIWMREGGWADLGDDPFPAIKRAKLRR